VIRRAATSCLALCLLCGAAAGELFDRAARDFAAQVDAGALELLPAAYHGRVAILETLAREQLVQMVHSTGVEGLSPVVAYLELYFNAGTCADRPVLYVREKNMRAFLAGRLDANSAAAFQATRRIPPAALLDADGWMALFRAGRADRGDFTRAGAIGSLRDALPELADRKEMRVAIDRLSARYSSFMATGLLRVVPGGPEGWQPLEEVFAGAAAQSRPALPPIASKWLALQTAWRRRDADEVNRLAAALEKDFAAAGPKLCPARRARELERFYNRTAHSAIVLAGFAVSLGLLIVAMGTGLRWMRLAGMGAFGLSTLAMVAAFVVRWLVSGRAWYLPPIMNQFEAVIGSAMLAAVLAFALELAWKRGFFALAAALYATVSLLGGALFPEQMESSVRAQHGILASPVMAVHVAVIIIGHAMVGMTFFLSLLYLGAAGARWLASGRGPASSAPDLRPAGELPALAAIDRCNLIVAQLACWMVVAGTLLGAYWGDFAWGRWWGWDPKETWALITCLVYVAVLHVRFVTPPRTRGMVTALLCILGCLVMLFNWIVVNFLLPGKHSYA